MSEFRQVQVRHFFQAESNYSIFVSHELPLLIEFVCRVPKMYQQRRVGASSEPELDHWHRVNVGM